MLKPKTYTLRFRGVNRDIFRAIKNGTKKIETRAATAKYRFIKSEDTVRLVCGKSKFIKKVWAVRKFRSIKAILKKYKPKEINPKAKSSRELEKIYYSFPGYREKIKKYGLVAVELD